jgi:hypothetical protein
MNFEEASAIFRYDPVSGELRWRKRLSGRTTVGELAGRLNGYGYLRVTVDGRTYMVHRIAWLLANGSWPERQIDHINGSRADNRICNLREANPEEQMQNLRRYKNNTSGFPGVRRTGSGKWQALIAQGGKRVCLGSFDTPEEAAEAYAKAKAALHTFNPVARAA